MALHPKHSALWLFATLVLVITGCARQAPVPTVQAPTEPAPTPRSIATQSVSPLATGLAPTSPLSAGQSPLATPTQAAGQGEPPAPVVAAASLVAQQTGQDVAGIHVERFEAVQWSDACLGVHQAGEMCAQVITPGYRVIFTTPNGTYEVHTDATGRSGRLVQGMGQGSPIVGTPSASALPPAGVAAQNALASQLKVPSDQLSLKSSERREWSDACLGVPTQDEMCAQVMVQGYLFVFSGPQGTYEVHTDANGQNVRVVNK